MTACSIAWKSHFPASCIFLQNKSLVKVCRTEKKKVGFFRLYHSSVFCDKKNYISHLKGYSVVLWCAAVLLTHPFSFQISIFTHLKWCSHCLFMLLCMFSESRLVNKYKQMDCLTQQSIRTVEGQQCVSALMSIMWNPIKWRAFRATYGLFHHVNDAMSSVIGAWLTSDWIVVYGLVDAQ